MINWEGVVNGFFWELESLCGSDADMRSFDFHNGGTVVWHDLAQPFEDGFMKGWKVEQAGEYCGGLPHDLGLFAAFLFQFEEAGVFKCGRCLIGESLYQNGVFFGKCAHYFAVKIYKADQFILNEHGYTHPAADVFGTCPFLKIKVLLGVIQNIWLAAFNDGFPFLCERKDLPDGKMPWDVTHGGHFEGVV